MTDLTITLTGEVRESNFEEWKDGLVERIRAVDVELSADDDFASANDSIRQFRAAERTLRDAKQAALEQAADINRLFDAVDAVTEETRQARLALERRIRIRRQELKQRTLQAHADGNAATLDALPPAQQALFQDRATLLSLPFDELESTIAQRIEVWQATLADPAAHPGAHSAADTPSGDPDASGQQGPRSFGGAPADERRLDAEQAASERAASGDDAVGSSDTDGAPRAWRVTIDLSAPRAKADQLFARVHDRWKTDRAVTGVDLSAVD